MRRGRSNVNRCPPRWREAGGARQIPPARRPCRLADRQIPCWYAPRNPASEDKMKNYLDGGEANLEAFRKLKIYYIMSSPGSESSSIQEALARPTLDTNA